MKDGNGSYGGQAKQRNLRLEEPLWRKNSLAQFFIVLVVTPALMFLRP